MLAIKVVKIGGNELDRPAWVAECAQVLSGIGAAVVVHGGGRAVSDRRTIQVEDIMASEAEFPETVSRMRQAGVVTRTMVATPLLREGTLAPMRSSVPTVSSVSWTGFMTGRNPGKHGIYGFTDVKRTVAPNTLLAKAGLVALTRSLAQEFGRFNIRVNIVCPGTVRTPIWDARSKRNPEVLKQLTRWYPLGRIVEPIEVMHAVAFLALAFTALHGLTLVLDSTVRIAPPR